MGLAGRRRCVFLEALDAAIPYARVRDGRFAPGQRNATRARGALDVELQVSPVMIGNDPASHENVARTAREAGVKTLVLTHVLEQIDRPGIREKVISEIAKIDEGHIIWGEDLMEVPISGPAPAKIR